MCVWSYLPHYSNLQQNQLMQNTHASSGFLSVWFVGVRLGYDLLRDKAIYIEIRIKQRIFCVKRVK